MNWKEMREFQRIQLPKSFEEMTFKRKLAVMLMFVFDGNSFWKKKEGIKEDAKIKSYFLFNYKERKPLTFHITVAKFAKMSASLHLWKNL